MSREFTKEEIREQVLRHVKMMAGYWAVQPLSDADKCDGVAFSILTMIDGSASIPPLELAVCTDDEFRDYLKSKGENYYPQHMVLNDDCMLHELYSQLPDFDVKSATQADDTTH